MHSLKLLRTTEKILDFLNEQVELEHTKTIGEVFPLLESVAAVFPNWVTMVCPLHDIDVRFVSSNCQNVFGYDAAYMQENIDIEKFYRMVHPDDAEQLHGCLAFLSLFCSSNHAKNSTGCRLAGYCFTYTRGFTNKEIASRLNISQNTSRNIRSKLFEKFRVNNVVELLNVAV